MIITQVQEMANLHGHSTLCCLFSNVCPERRCSGPNKPCTHGGLVNDAVIWLDHLIFPSCFHTCAVVLLTTRSKQVMLGGWHGIVVAFDQHVRDSAAGNTGPVS